MSTDSPVPTEAPRERIVEAIRRRIGIDPRSLAAFRIALGLLLIADLLLRSRDLRAHYTDFGVLPRAALITEFARPERVSIHLASGEAWAQAVLFVVAGVVAAALAAGYRTRSATVASWLLLNSLHLRNPVVLNGGDAVLRMALFWSMFLPLGGAGRSTPAGRARAAAASPALRPPPSCSRSSSSTSRTPR